MPSPVEYTVDAARHLILVEYTRQPTFEEWKAAMDNIFADPRFQPTFGILIDRRGVSFPPPHDYIVQMARYIDAKAERFSSLRWAIVTGSMSSYGLGLIAEKMVCNKVLRTFLIFNEAIGWLAGEIV